MTKTTDARDPTLPLSVVRRINEVCNRFELAWLAGPRPAIEDFLGDTPEPERSDLARELVALDINFRRQAGEEPQADDYRTRFPALALAPLLAGRAAELAGAAAHLPVVPGYDVLKELGRGGMGVVYWAWQGSLSRTVALKMLRGGADAGPPELARFRTEAEAVARLHHPHIVQVYDVGLAERCPYLALEFVDGGSLAQKLTGTPLPARHAARLLELVARAVQAAHQKGVVHRDLTPANVLLARSDSAHGVPLGGPEETEYYEPKVTDFGLAKLLVGGGPTLTHSGTILGTPSYMAPEQAGGHGKEVGPATDVYALGAILYELLTGRPPFKAETLLDTLKQVETVEPVAPSRLQPKLPRDLTTICLKCLAKEPHKRYASAEELAEDLRRFQAGEPIRARPVGRTERLIRWCRRNPAVATLAGSVALLLVLIAIGSSVLSWRLHGALTESEADRDRAERAEGQGKEKLWQSYRDQARALRLSRHPGQRLDSLRAIRKAMQLPLPPGHSRDELRTEAIGALALPDLELLREWDGYPAGSVGLDFDGNLERYARLAEDGTVSVRRVSDDALIARWREPTQGAWPYRESNLRFSPDGRFLAIFHPPSRRLMVRRLDGPEPVVCHRGTNVVDGWAMDFSPDSKRLAYLLTDTRFAVVDLACGQVSHLPATGAEQWDIRFAPDGRQFALVTRRAGKWAVEVRDAARGQVRQSLLHPARPVRPAWHPDGRTLATGCNDRLLRLWDVPAGQLLRELKGHRIEGINCAFTRTGDRLLSNDWHSVLRVWEPSSGRQLLSFPAAGYDILRVSPDDRVSAMHVADTTKLQLLRLHAGREYQTIELGGGPSNRGIDYKAFAMVHPGGRLLAARGTDGSVVVVDLSAGREVATLRLPGGRPLLWEPAGALLTCGTFGVQRWALRADPRELGHYRLGPPELLPSPGHGGNVRWGCSANAQTVAIPNYNRGAVLVHRGPPTRTVRLQPQQDVRTCAVSRDGRWVATGSHENTDGFGAKVWDAATAKLVKQFRLPKFCWVAFSPDGRWLLTTSGGCRLWEVGSWNAGPKVGGATGCFSPNGRLLAVEDSAGAIRLVRPESGAQLARLEAPEQTRLIPSCFTPDGTRLIAVGVETQALHVWDLRAVRAQLAALDLDWNLPPYPPAAQDKVPPLTGSVDYGNLFVPTHPHQAVGVYSLALALCPLNPEAYLQRGRAYGILKERNKAIADYTLFLALVPPRDKRRAEVLFRRSNNYRDLHQRADWLADLLQVVQLNLDEIQQFHTQVAGRCNELAWQLVTGPEKERDPAQALPLARKAVSLMPKEPMYSNTLGVVYYRLERYRPAVEALERSLRESKGRKAAYDLLFLALCHAGLDDAIQARDCYNRALRWLQEHRGELAARERKELDAFQAEARAVLQKDGKP
jgi:serine/threonine protein kinase/WD40 repeat protein